MHCLKTTCSPCYHQNHLMATGNLCFSARRRDGFYRGLLQRVCCFETVHIYYAVPEFFGI